MCKGLLCDNIPYSMQHISNCQLRKVVRSLQYLPPCNSCQVKGVYRIYFWSSDSATNEDNNIIILHPNTNITCLSEIKPRNKKKGNILEHHMFE